MIINSLYNSLSQNILSIFGENTQNTEQESAKQNNVKDSAVSNRTFSGDKISISAEAMALYSQQRQIEAAQEYSNQTQSESNQGGNAQLGDNTSSISSQIQALQGQLAGLMSQVNSDDPVALGQIEQLRTQISILQAQMSA
ncbi:MAG: hypothetical protein IJU40_06970 [Desulfovibrionaceae bacterium]|nr:hypothetical protein [Desulfovibrionaceae bacterium]